MKTFLVALVFSFAVGTVNSQMTDPDDPFVGRFIQQPANESLLYLPSPKPNEVTMNGVTYDGILVQLAETPHPWELINPAAPPEYGSSDDNVVHSQIDGRANGLKLFSIRF